MPDLMTELTEEEKTAKGNGSTMNSSNEDRELENLSSEIVDGEEQVVLDDAAATEDNGAEEDTFNEVAVDLGEAVARLGVEDDENLLDDEAVVGDEAEMNVIDKLEVIVGKKEKRKVKVKRLPLHRLATQDICEVGNRPARHPASSETT